MIFFKHSSKASILSVDQRNRFWFFREGIVSLALSVKWTEFSFSSSEISGVDWSLFRCFHLFQQLFHWQFPKTNYWEKPLKGAAKIHEVGSFKEYLWLHLVSTNFRKFILRNRLIYKLPFQSEWTVSSA